MDTREGASGVFPATGVTKGIQSYGLQLGCILHTDPICGMARPENCEDPILKSQPTAKEAERLLWHHGEATWVWSQWLTFSPMSCPYHGNEWVEGEGARSQSSTYPARCGSSVFPDIE